MVLTVSSALSLVTGLVCHHRLADTSAKLDASVGASGPHDFAVRLCAVRLRAISVHRIPLPNVRDDRDTPLLRVRDGESIKLFLLNREAKYFFKDGWTAISQNSPSGKSVEPSGGRLAQ
jgi:hypothetical protein